MSILACGGKESPPATSPHGDPAAPGEHAQHHHHRFDDAAHWAKEFDDPTRDQWQKPARVVELMHLAPGMTVADVGAGTGYFMPHLAQAVGPSGKVLEQDIEPNLVQWMKDRAAKASLANVEVVLGAADDPRLGTDVDRILVVDTWHHIEDRKAYAKKLVAKLKPGGAVFVVDFTKESPFGPPPAMRLTPAAIVADFATSGASASVIPDAGLPNQYVVRAAAAPSGS